MMRSSKVNRKDIVTNQQYDREKLIRIAVSKEGVTTIDREYDKGGRGIYIHPTSIDKGFEKNILKRNIKRFGGDINDVKEELMEVKNG